MVVSRNSLHETLTNEPLDDSWWVAVAGLTLDSGVLVLLHRKVVTGHHLLRVHLYLRPARWNCRVRAGEGPIIWIGSGGSKKKKKKLRHRWRNRIQRGGPIVVGEKTSVVVIVGFVGWGLGKMVGTKKAGLIGWKDSYGGSKGMETKDEGEFDGLMVGFEISWKLEERYRQD